MRRFPISSQIPRASSHGLKAKVNNGAVVADLAPLDAERFLIDDNNHRDRKDVKRLRRHPEPTMGEAGDEVLGLRKTACAI